MSIKPGFYSIRQAGEDQDPLDGQAWGLAMLLHLKEGRFVGVDQGGCKVTGKYQDSLNGGNSLQMIYDLKCGSHLFNGMVLEADHRIEATIDLTAETTTGGHQLLDIGLGPMFISLEWLADPA
ncbi:hypothetical protein GRI62_11690 [Erythrobacter arachoides]|uniref:Uncharacterized protein n=1 Tax=Aurantiacibacter arachoides TaxID=1850444 RepID=A0A845A2U7_9SPHN|nr:hypothetical protein [Aurantiacibacter arachoides]MXO94258.1 hypothetical protein [Aurantiacibacter arachoides]